MEVFLENLTELIERIKNLSPESQAKLADQVAFLEWQEVRSQAEPVPGWSFNFIEAFRTAAVYSSREPEGMDVKLAPAAVGGEIEPALWAHPPLVGQAVIEYHVPIPQQVRQIRLHLAIGIRDKANIAEDNLVAFSVKVNGMRVWGQQSNAQTWQMANIPLDLPTGDVVQIAFTTEVLGSHEWTWAVWGNPELSGLITQ